jgi:hypothetical protein
MRKVVDNTHLVTDENHGSSQYTRVSVEFQTNQLQNIKQTRHHLVNLLRIMSEGILCWYLASAYRRDSQTFTA